MTTILSTRELLQIEGTFSEIKVKAEVQTEAGVIKKIGNGSFFKGELQIGNFVCEENNYLNISIHNGGLENQAAVCAALPLFIADVQTKIAE